jgi:hypothetical protein
MKCEICNKEVNGTKGLSTHLTKYHKVDIKEYYDKYLKKKGEGKCYFCKNDAIFFNLTKGYHRICNSKDCLGKTRATGTYEFLMYKYNLSKKNAIKLMNDRSLNRGKKITNGLRKSFEKNKNFFKEKSVQCIEYWLKKGYCQDEAEKEVQKSFNNIHTKTWKKRRENPELYKNVNTAQLDYWLKKGYNKKEAKIKLSERQKTFTLEKCIEKYGEIDGKKKWLDRQEKWMNNYKKSNFSKVSQELFWKLYEKLNKKDEIYFATLKDGMKDDSGKNNEYKLKLENMIISPDFLIKEENKIIEFDGTYYHRKNTENKKRQRIRDNQLHSEGFDIFHVKESDYYENKEKTIQKCMNFLNS